MLGAAYCHQGWHLRGIFVLGQGWPSRILSTGKGVVAEQERVTVRVVHGSIVHHDAVIKLSRCVDSHLTTGNKGLCLDQAVFFYMWCADDGVTVVQMQVIVEQRGDVQEVRVAL